MAIGLKCGGICAGCQGLARCKKNLAAAPIAMTCPGCGGSGCADCDKTGSLDIVACPLSLIDVDTWDLLDYAALWEKGLPPVAGGALDQTIWFMRAATWIFNEITYWKKKLGIIDG